MIVKDERNKKQIFIRDPKHIYQRLHERGKMLFGKNIPKNMFEECMEAIRNPQKSVIFPDERKKDSTHHCVFISDSGGYVCLPCVIDENKITVVTLKNVQDDHQQQWYVRKYNEIAKQRNLSLMSYVFGKR